MIRKIVLCVFFIIGTSCSHQEKQKINIPYYSNSKELLRDTWDRPDLRVSYLRAYPHFWINSAKVKLALSESLHKTGYYQESLGIAYQLLLSPMNFFDRGKNYFTIARNYDALGTIDQTRFYLDKAIKRNNQYYFFYYARLEEFQENFPEALTLYEKALSHKFGEKDYIVSAYERMLHSALIYYKKRDIALYYSTLSLIKENPYFSPVKIRIIERAIVL